MGGVRARPLTGSWSYRFVGSSPDFGPRSLLLAGEMQEQLHITSLLQGEAVEVGGVTQASHMAFSSHQTGSVHANVDQALWVKHPPHFFFFHFNLLII